VQSVPVELELELETPQAHPSCSGHPVPLEGLRHQQRKHAVGPEGSYARHVKLWHVEKTQVVKKMNVVDVMCAASRHTVAFEKIIQKGL